MSLTKIESLITEIGESTKTPSQKSNFWTKKHSKPIALAIVIAAFNQLSGINIILYFAPRLLSMAGIEDALASSVSLGVTNLIFTFVGLWFIDRLGRKSLLYVGSLGYIISLGACAFAFLSVNDVSQMTTGLSWLVLISIMVFIASHAVGQGAVIWVFISEIFPNEHRAYGQALGSFTHWFFAALLTFLFPLAIEQIDAGYIFGFFSLMMVLQLLWVKTKVPETKGKTLEEMNELLSKTK
ncbi:sugar porter family MFS transporter [Seonamhaeicola marinus]|uniref:Sugar porter family MFS transporter n=2 Tax=Seonamhaeicola marinus TaxID=1912246 RepID=A0A5D0J5Q3_9FLAO|nr:sugar porter family MFS transporter [Seonamhaeicola marinus]